MATFINILEKHGIIILKIEVTFIMSFTSQIQAAVSSEIIVPCTKLCHIQKKIVTVHNMHFRKTQNSVQCMK